MKLSSIPQAYRHLARWREILAVLSKYGLADWFSRLPLEFTKDWLRDPDGAVLARHSFESRIRMALIELGPTFVKLGQMLSTRPDLVGVVLATELTQLQTDVRADAAAVVRSTVESELGQPLESIFAEFDELPLASASIGQVHRALLIEPRVEVVVKVQHEGIEQKVAVDLEILYNLAALSEQLPEFAPYGPKNVVEEFQRVLRRELDFTRETRNMQQFAALFARDTRLVVPRVYPEFCTRRVLTMQRITGIKLLDRTALEQSGVDLKLVARRGAELYTTMIFEHGFYHADPHPGNLLLLPDNVIGLLDYGMVGRIDEPLREDIEEMFLALANRDGQHLTSIIMRVGAVPHGLDESSLSLDVNEFLNHYATQAVESLDVGSALNEMIEMIRRYQITLPARIAVLLRVLVMLEGTSRLLSPQFSLMDVILPYQSKMMWRRLSPRRHAKKLRRLAGEFERLIEVLPRGLIDLLNQVQSGKFDVHLDHRGLEPSVNRLVLGLLTSSLFLGSTLLLAHHVRPVVQLPWMGEISLLGLLGATLAMLLGLRLLRAINKSGHLDRRD